MRFWLLLLLLLFFVFLFRIFFFFFFFCLKLSQGLYTCLQTAKGLARLRLCVGSPEPLQVAHLIFTLFSCAGYKSGYLFDQGKFCQLQEAQDLEYGLSKLKAISSRIFYFHKNDSLFCV